MKFSALFHPEFAPVALDGAFHYVVLSALQWKTPNLDLMATASKQRFAVLYNQPLEERFAIDTLEQAHIQGALSGVKLVAIHEDVLRIFLSDEVSASTFADIEALWEPIKKLDLNRRLEVDFSCEHEAYSGRSDYLFWPAVKEVLESNSLGIERYKIPVLHDCAMEVSIGDEPTSHHYHVDIRTSFSSEPAIPAQINPMAFNSFRVEQQAIATSEAAHNQLERLDCGVSHVPNPFSPITPLSKEDVRALAEAVGRIAILRDRALCVIALSGVRQAELLRLKAGDIQSDGFVASSYKASISSTRRVTRKLPAPSAAMLLEYVKESGLSNGDYLFPSRKNPDHPMSQFELKRILRAWGLEAQLNPQKVSIRALREAFIICALQHRSVPTLDALAAAMGHPWPGLLSQYIRGIDKTPKA